MFLVQKKFLFYINYIMFFSTISKNQFGFMPRWSTMEDIFLFRCLIKKYREAPKDLHVIFIDPEKAYDRDLESLCVGFLEK